MDNNTSVKAKWSWILLAIFVILSMCGLCAGVTTWYSWKNYGGDAENLEQPPEVEAPVEKGVLSVEQAIVPAGGGSFKGYCLFETASKEILFWFENGGTNSVDQAGAYYCYSWSTGLTVTFEDIENELGFFPEMEVIRIIP